MVAFSISDCTPLSISENMDLLLLIVVSSHEGELTISSCHPHSDICSDDVQIDGISTSFSLTCAALSRR